MENQQLLQAGHAVYHITVLVCCNKYYVMPDTNALIRDSSARLYNSQTLALGFADC